MKKETLANKMARKSFESSVIQQSWQVHFQAFKPMLEPAFVDNFQAKIHLTAALNLISNGNFIKGLPKLKKIQKYIKTDADKAAYLFFMGLYCEMSGNISQMVEMYGYANEYKHRFYLPYMKVARLQQKSYEYDSALANYVEAIECFNVDSLSEQEKLIVASAYANMATCLTMMHQYDEAMQHLEQAYSLDVKLPDITAVEAILFAAIGENKKAKNSLEQLKDGMSESYENIKKIVESIFDNTNPAFFPVEIDNSKIEQFWDWFGAYSSVLAQRLDKKQYEEGMMPVSEKLLETFPFMEESPFVALGQNENGYVIELHDMYFVAVSDAYSKLLSACPEELKKSWQFVVVH